MSAGEPGKTGMRDILSQIDAGNGDPVRASQEAMRTPLPKRFYKNAVATEQAAEDGSTFAVELDGKPVRTPARSLLAFPTLSAARLVAAEFEAQATEIDPAKMPITRIANTAIDGVAVDPQAVREDIVRFAASDLLCYRAGSPAELVSRQNVQWDPFIDWMRDELGANFVLAEGVIHVEQPREAIAAFGAALRQFPSAFEITCLHMFTTLTGSAILALAMARGRAGPKEVWQAAHVDEDWNISQWGADEEAAARRAYREAEFNAAAAFFDALKQD